MSKSTKFKDYRSAFHTILAGLNSAQREAVNQIDGPVLVIAGPGTGKTHILASRIGKILIETDTPPNSILCLTFTDAGVQAMRRRLIEFIGPEAHKIQIYTFHSFSNRIIQENLEYFGQQGLEPISDLERLEVIRNILLNLGIDHPLRIGKSKPYFYEGHLQHLFRSMKMEHWSPNLIHSRIDEYLADLPNRPENIYQINRGNIKKGSIKTAKIEEIHHKMDRLRAATSLFPTYQDSLKQLQRYDYEDMVILVNQAFQKNKVLLRRYQERFLYILVDEYQDTNGAQNQLIQYLVDYWENPNLFIVGDDDQSIYEFQGARLKNISDFYQKFQRYLSIVLLTENYRSTQPILDRASQLISNNKNRIINALSQLDIQKRLIAANKKRLNTTILPAIHSYPNRFQETIGLVLAIQQALQDNLALEDIAIIYAKHRQAEVLIQLLEKLNLPFNTKRSINILTTNLIEQLKTLLQYITFELNHPGRGEHLIYPMLHFQFFKISREDIEKLSWSIRRKNISWREAIANKDFLNELNLDSAKAVHQLSILLKEWITFAANHSVVLLVEKLLNSGGILQYVSTKPDKAYQVQVLHTFLSFVQQESKRKPHLSPASLIETINKLNQNYIGIPLLKVYTNPKGVHLLTAHSAKGLEYRKVFIIDATKDHWEPRSRASAFQFPLPDTLTFGNETNEMEARRRLFYVATTRAQEELTISYSQQNEKGKPLERSIFIDEFINDSTIESQTKQVAEEILVNMQMLSLTHKEAPRAEPLKPEWVNDLLQDFRLSPSSFNTFLNCPLGFYYTYVLRLPQINSEPASYGIAVHHALEKLFQRIKVSTRNRIPAKSTLIRYFTTELARQKSNFSNISWNRYRQQGIHNLGKFYDLKHPTWHKNVIVELSIREGLINQVPVKGTIDKLELLKNNLVNIIDYKTGSHDSSKLRPPSKGTPFGGSYWRQLVFYSLLFKSYDRFNRQINNCSIVYVEPDNKGRFEQKDLKILLEDQEFIASTIQQTYQKIMNHQFYDGCGKKDCQWCNFTQSYHSSKKVSAETELIDDKYF